MLFYNENDEICIKYEDSTYKVIGELDYLEVDGEWYRFSNNYFYEAQECDGDLDTNWDIRTHVRHMNIVEMEEAFAPPTYKNSLLDDVFRFEKGLKEDE